MRNSSCYLILRDVQFSQEMEFPTVDVAINRERAGLMGVKVADAARSLVAATTSSRFTVPNYWADSKTGVSYSLQVQIPQALTQSLEDLKNVPVSTKDGKDLAVKKFRQPNTRNRRGPIRALQHGTRRFHHSPISRAHRWARWSGRSA